MSDISGLSNNGRENKAIKQRRSEDMSIKPAKKANILCLFVFGNNNNNRSHTPYPAALPHGRNQGRSQDFRKEGGVGKPVSVQLHNARNTCEEGCNTKAAYYIKVKGVLGPAEAIVG